MIANAAFLAALTTFLAGRLAGRRADVPGAVQGRLFRHHGTAIGVGDAVLVFLNLCARLLRRRRWLFLRDTGRKLTHVDRQLDTARRRPRGPAASSLQSVRSGGMWRDDPRSPDPRRARASRPSRGSRGGTDPREAQSLRPARCVHAGSRPAARLEREARRVTAIGRTSCAGPRCGRWRRSAPSASSGDDLRDHADVRHGDRDRGLEQLRECGADRHVATSSAVTTDRRS